MICGHIFHSIKNRVHQSDCPWKGFNWYLIVVFVVLFHTPLTGHTQFIGVPAIQNYEVNEYEAGIHNYQITQDRRGIIYIANNLGLLMFDGANWELLQVTNGTKVRSVFVTEKGRIYVGAQNELGYFFPNSNGRYEYHSLKHLIPEAQRNFDDVWRIHELDDELIFTVSGNVFAFTDEQTIMVVLSSSEFGYTYKVRGQLMTKFENRPLSVLEDNEWRTRYPNNELNDKSVVNVIAHDQGRELIATLDNGLYLQNHGQVSVFAEKYRELLTTHEISSAIQLDDGNYAVGTNSNGLYIFNRDGELVYHFNEEKGLIGRTIMSIYEDVNGAIWLGLNNGIAKINWNYPFSFINDATGLPGTGYSAAPFNGKIYFATNNGVYRSDGGIEPINNVERISGITGQVYRLQSEDNQLLVSANNGAFAITENNTYMITDEDGWWCFVPTSDANLMIGGSYDGLGLFEKKNNQWTLKKRYENFSESSRLLAFQGNTLWMSHGYKGVYSFTFSEDFEDLETVNHYGVDQGLPSNLLNNLFDISDEVLFTSEQGVYIYDENTGRFTPHDQLYDLIGNDNHILYMASDTQGTIYFIGERLSGILNRDRWGEYSLQEFIFNGIEDLLNDDLSNIAVLETDQILLAASNGFVHFNNNYEMARTTHPVLLHQISLTNQDSLLFEGNFLKDSTEVMIHQPEGQVPVLNFGQNNLNFIYSMPSFDIDPPEFRYRLIGYQDEWSEWTKNTSKEYTNLMEGEYVFEVEGRDLYHIEAIPAQFSFTILPPWYRTVWAYLCYILGLLAILYITIEWFKRKHEKEKADLMDTQKKELWDKNNELTQLRNEKLTEQIRFKKRELATSTMHILEKNELMHQIKNQVNELLSSDKTTRETKTTLKRVVKHIDQNINEDDDWNQFEINFDEAHGDFIKTIRADYPALTHQEVKLCSYLKMNMATKEIAHLLKISVRGVEIARYRLRKKLAIDKSVNLNDFMMNYGLSESNA